MVKFFGLKVVQLINVVFSKVSSIILVQLNWNKKYEIKSWIVIRILFFFFSFSVKGFLNYQLKRES